MKYDCIMELKVFVDEVYPKDNIYDIKLDAASRIPIETDSLSMRQNIMEGFELSCNIDKDILTEQYIRYLVMLVICVLAFLIVTYLITATSAKKAMKDVLSLVAEIEGGDILTSGEDEKWHEVAVVKNKITDLTNRLYKSGVREYETELKRRKLEIEILNSKINPHLIYNSLSVIKLVAYREKCLSICDATDILVNYYRLVLNKGEDTISVALELEYMEKYIGIYKISKKFNYEVDYDVCEEAFDIMIPHMLLQPVLENALIHGLKNPKNARISIVVYCEDDKLYIKMSDNGVGMDEDKLRRLNERKDLGYGLKSVIQRADYFYDGDFDFTIESEKGKGTTVSLTVPRNIRKAI